MPSPTCLPAQVYLIYCDGMSFSGTRGSLTVPGHDTIYSAGYSILQAFQVELFALGLGKPRHLPYRKGVI